MFLRNSAQALVRSPINEVQSMVRYCKRNNLPLLQKALAGNFQFLTRLPEIWVSDLHSQTFSLLHICAAYGSIDCFKYLLDKGTDINQQNNENWNCLHFACRHDKLEIAKILLTYGVSVKTTTAEGYSPLLLAAWFGSLELVDLIFRYEGDIKHIDNYKCTALHRACQSSFTKIVTFLLNNGADPNQPNEQGYPLQISSSLGDTDTMVTLIEHGAEIDAI